MPKLLISDLELKGKRVFLRVDFNVPLDESGNITDDSRIRAALPTIQYGLDHGARLVLASHLGRPKGKQDSMYSLEPAARRLSELVGRQVQLAPGSSGQEVESLVNGLGDGELLMLENLRFNPGEEKNDPDFSRQLAALADEYVNDAFGAAHRAHASTEGITHFVRRSAAGFLMEKELRYLGQAIEAPERPFLVLLGGAKVSDKIAVIENLIRSADALLIGGAMANTFFKASGFEIGCSLAEEDKLDVARRLISAAASARVDLTLPVDCVVSDKNRTREPRVCEPAAVAKDEAILDIGPASVKLFGDRLGGAKTIVWNGPMGLFEQPPYDRGTRAVAEAVASSGATTIVGGGDSVAAVTEAGVADRITHISTGGGASLEFLAGEVLPGVAALSEAA